jgi:hypothetical protein
LTSRIPADRLWRTLEGELAPRRFADSSGEYGLAGAAALSIACEDLNGDGRPELVVCNYRQEFEHDTESFVY